MAQKRRTRGWPVVAVALAGGLTTGGCGDPLLPPGVYDSPLLGIKGYVKAMAGQVALEHPEVTLRWIDPLGESDEEVFAPKETIRVDWTGDDTFTLQIFSPPPAETAVSLVDFATGETLTRFSFAELVLYDDANDDHRFELATGSELYRGGGTTNFVVYVWQPMTDTNVPKTLGNVFMGEVGYRLGYVNCDNPLIASLNAFPRSSAPPAVPITVQAPSADMPFERTCLQSRYVPPP
jgi:hypothetical protein